MTFASEMVQCLYHKLPTEKQLQYSRLEEFLADTGKSLHVDGVMQLDSELELVVRVREQLDSAPIAISSNAD